MTESSTGSGYAADASVSTEPRDGDADLRAEAAAEVEAAARAVSKAMDQLAAAKEAHEEAKVKAAAVKGNG